MPKKKKNFGATAPNLAFMVGWPLRAEGLPSGARPSFSVLFI